MYTRPCCIALTNPSIFSAFFVSSTFHLSICAISFIFFSLFSCLSFISSAVSSFFPGILEVPLASAWVFKVAKKLRCLATLAKRVTKRRSSLMAISFSHFSSSIPSPISLVFTFSRFFVSFTEKLSLRYFFPASNSLISSSKSTSFFPFFSFSTFSFCDFSCASTFFINSSCFFFSDSLSFFFAAMVVTSFRLPILPAPFADIASSMRVVSIRLFDIFFFCFFISVSILLRLSVSSFLNFSILSCSAFTAASASSYFFLILSYAILVVLKWSCAFSREADMAAYLTTQRCSRASSDIPFALCPFAAFGTKPFGFAFSASYLCWRASISSSRRSRCPTEVMPISFSSSSSFNVRRALPLIASSSNFAAYFSSPFIADIHATTSSAFQFFIAFILLFTCPTSFISVATSPSSMLIFLSVSSDRRSKALPFTSLSSNTCTWWPMPTAFNHSATSGSPQRLVSAGRYFLFTAGDKLGPPSCEGQSRLSPPPSLLFPPVDDGGCSPLPFRAEDAAEVGRDPLADRGCPALLLCAAGFLAGLKSSSESSESLSSDSSFARAGFFSSSDSDSSSVLSTSTFILPFVTFGV
mmetsp:Transcript_29860/g.77073  ORF Transcript_29860/g.77073 Transcript_29860/m.77073 type:complete len:583 (+) Transcript_29860:1003-2751(+)